MKIEVKNLNRKIDNQNVLSNINLEVNSGKIYGIIGRNGSGKSILLKTICGFIKPTNGQVLVDGVEIYKKNIFPSNTAALLDIPSYIPDLTGYENLELLASINKKIGKEEIIQTLEKVNLYEEKDKKFKKYSLGMKQKLGIAQVLMENPEIMIFDEPFNGLDEESTTKIRKILISEKENGKLIIIATHIKKDIDNLCDEVFEINNGILKKKR